MQTALALLPDFLLILLGQALRRWLHLGDHFWTGLEKLVYFVLFPALLFNSIARANLALSEAAPLLLAGLLTMMTGMLLGGMARWLFPITPISFASQFQCAFRFNTYIGLAVAAKLHGTAGIAMMGLLGGAKNPLVLATIAGLLWNMTGIALPVPAGQLLGRLADAAIALGLLAVGAALKIDGRPGGGYAAGAWFLAVKLLALPVAAIGLARLFGLTGMIFDVLLAYAALPTASSAYILAQRMGGDGRSVAWLISVGTLLAMLTLPLWLAFGR
jgi:malonate transporter